MEEQLEEPRFFFMARKGKENRKGGPNLASFSVFFSDQ
jgi:hypothetical protein